MTKEQLVEQNKGLEFDILTLQKAIDEKEKQILFLQEENKKIQEELDEAKRVNEQAIHNEHALRLDSNKFAGERKQFVEENENLKKTLNTLADLFNDSFVALKDLNAILGVVQRNSTTILGSVESKLNVFNGTTEPPKK